VDQRLALNEFQLHTRALRQQAEVLQRLLEGWLSDTGLKLHSVTSRVKSEGALAHKLSRPDRTYADLWDVTDVIGLRVTTYFEDAIDAVAKIIERHLPVDFAHSVDKRQQREPSAFGYRSLHYVCDFGDARVPGLPARARCEIQLRTLLQHTWAEIEHDLGYKTQDALPVSLRRRFSRISSLLEIADQEFTAVQQELREYSARLPARVLGAAGEVPIDRLSLSSVLDQPQVHALDTAIAERLGRPLDRDAFFPDYLVRMLVLSGIERVSDVLTLLAEHEVRILAMVEPYFDFASREWKLSPAQMPAVYRGYSLFFLAHVALLRSPLLGISKVDRLARFYGELDYPDDPRAAQRIAAGLLTAFRET
jgi:ppGpp synthetase/RelA/SpoT-type nucleotidyltranferase